MSYLAQGRSKLVLWPSSILSLFELAKQLKVGYRRIDLGNRVLGLIFKKASTRTRVSFQVAMARLGGQTVDLNPQVTQLGRGETIKDTARVLSRYCDVLAIRTYSQKELESITYVIIMAYQQKLVQSC